MDSGFAALPRPGMTTKSAIHLQRGDEGLLRDVDLAEPSVWHETTGLICPRVWTDFCAGTHDVTTSGSGKRMAVNTDHTDNMRDIDAARADRDSNRRALQCCQGDDRIKHTRSPMIEKRLFQLFCRVGVLIGQLHCRNSCISRALPTIDLALHFRTECQF